jgi:hypothetical protein
MIKITSIIRDIIGSSAKALHAVAEDNSEWVLRLKKIDKNARRLFNEYVAVSLALEFGLSCPETEIAYVADSVIPEEYENVFLRSEQYGVAVKFINDIRHLDPPDNYNPTSPDFRKINRAHLEHYLKIGENLDQLYGYHVFVKWIQLEDDWKYENLLLRTSGKFIFLDLDFAFGGVDNKCEMENYQWRTMDIQPPFLLGILNNPSRFSPWIDRISTIKKDRYRELVNDVPSEFKISDDCTDQIASFLFSKRDKFIAELRLAISEGVTF